MAAFIHEWQLNTQSAIGFCFGFSWGIPLKTKDPLRVTTVTRALRSARRFFTRNEWVVWLLGLSRTADKASDPGLIMIQIDGLPKKQLEKAMAEGRMPFLQKLLSRESYNNHLLYSGLPSSTPAFQAELYYGSRTMVPAFGFRDHKSGRLVRMFSSEMAASVENKLRENGCGLLSGGSSYSNIYSGGAEEVHFCATSFGWSEFFSTVNPFKILIVLLLNFWMFVRVVGLMSIEFVLASLGFVRGIVSGKQFWQELIMIPARVVVVVLLRELVTIGACYDSARGLPIIHLNMLGYDEQAHRRGPESAFAHWTLQGIDRCIKRIWNAAHLGAGREYDLWVFSDHGQETTKPYQLEHRKLLQQVIADLVESEFSSSNQTERIESCTQNDRLASKRLPSRANWIGLGWLVSMLFGEQDHDIQARSALVQTVTSGPIGFVYLQTQSAIAKRSEFARQLVNQHHVPMCAYLDDTNTPIVVTDTGEYHLPNHCEDVFGRNHPFLNEITSDFIRMIRHVDSGDILLFGWNGHGETNSFVLQNGAHAGPGIDETSGFAMLPSDTLLPVANRSYLRPNDLRLAVLRFLGRDERGADLVQRTTRSKMPCRLLTYNVHACMGMDGQLSPERIARVIGQSEADIICLQELDVGRRRSGHRDQAHAIAQHLEMTHQFHPAWHLEEEQFGNAILTRLPMRVIQRKSLHHHKSDRSRRSAIWVEVDIDKDVSLQVINTHLSIYPQEQLVQAQQLIDDWIKPAKLLGPVVLCGDFNARPNSATHQLLNSVLADIESFDGKPARRTLFSPIPISRVDHGFLSEELVCPQVRIIDNRLARIASDHLPLVFDLKHLTLVEAKQKLVQPNVKRKCLAKARHK